MTDKEALLDSHFQALCDAYGSADTTPLTCPACLTELSAAASAAIRLGHITAYRDYCRFEVALRCPEGEFHRCTMEQHVAAYGGECFLYQGAVLTFGEELPPDPSDYGGRPR